MTRKEEEGINTDGGDLGAVAAELASWDEGGGENCKSIYEKWEMVVREYWS